MEKGKLRPVINALIFSLVLMIFPVVSGVIAVISGMNTLQSYWIQGVFMMLSISVPVIFMWIKKMKPAQIGFKRLKKDSLKTILYFIPIIAAKIGFLFCGITNDLHTIIALVFFTLAIGLSEEIYFRGIILRKLRTCFTIKQAIILSSALFAAVHASQAFSGADSIMVALTIVNALIFGIVASEIVILTESLVPTIIWHALYDFINWTALVKGKTEVIVIIIESIIIVFYALYLWAKLPDKNELY